MDEVEEEEEKKAGSPEWMTTYADLMSLLMCFFVLLLSFSEMDVSKYKQVAGSMAFAFGVQNEIKIKDIPKGTSIIAKEFSPGRPNPTPIKTIQQISRNTISNTLDIRTKEPGEEEGRGQFQQEYQKVLQENAEAAEELEKKLADEIEDGNIEVDYDYNAVTVRIREQGSFPSGSATLARDFLPIIPILQQALKDTPGAIAIEGHTDNVPIYTQQYRSNWELSSQRALSFAHALMKDVDLKPERFMVVGYADSRPIASNDNWRDRAKNRRVEILIRRSEEHAKYGL